ncbi:sulfide dehydrogenase [Halomonas urumqiensis]|uniref:Sulfide dehydrogenase n=2 Tax=Halomonas urumqiensis TaxID=1684789 RepID=A0A2N7UQ05_9GAMM|nr:sulfide dehydrogenase [Halomonas urumqiensis]PTB04363.1 cytochrome c [Halomonas urumqiensis]
MLASGSTLAGDDMLALGKQVFTEQAAPSCTICHTLSDAGSTGAIGPNLDDLKPTADMVRNAVKNGVGVMPAYRESLDEAQIDALAAYLVSTQNDE